MFFFNYFIYFDINNKLFILIIQFGDQITTFITCLFNHCHISCIWVKNLLLNLVLEIKYKSLKENYLL